MSLATKLAKLRGRSPHELADRAAQAVAAWRERAGLDPDARAIGQAAPGQAARGDTALARRLAPGAPRDARELLARFRERTAPAFFPAFSDPAATVAALRAHAPENERATLDAAERAAAGRFVFFGGRELAYGEPIDWHLDPAAGRRAPHDAHWSRIPYLDPARVGDHKIIWELNRQQYFATLGQAYWYSGDERWAHVFAGQLAAWMDVNPPKRGINWASSLEVSFRAISWLWALHYFRRSPALTPELYARALAYLHVHGRHLERYLSTYFSPNTHLTGEALGLVYLGALLPELALAPRWRATGRRILLSQLGRQVHADGVYFEQATYYHRYTVDFYLHLALLGELTGEPLPAGAATTVAKLADHLRRIARPDGRLPLVGDDDGGRLATLDAGAHVADVRGTLALAAAVFGRPEWRIDAAPTAEALWTLGDAGARRLAELGARAPAGLPSRAFRDGGYFVMRDGWDADAGYMLLDCGPHGTLNCGHAHADALAFELCAGGRPLLVDAGTYTYVGAERDAYRSSAAHNTVVVDGASSSEPGRGAFTWANVSHGDLRAWAATPRADYFEGTHDGFARLAEPATHCRSVLFVKGAAAGSGAGGYWIVRDRVLSAGAHRVSVRLHCAGGVLPRLLAPGELSLDDAADGRALLRVVAFGGGAFRAEEAWVSPSFGVRERSAACVYDTEGEGAQEVVTALLPTSVAAAAADAGDGARALTLEHASGYDLVLLGAGAGATARFDGVESDADVVWLRRDAGGAPAACFVGRGSWLRVDGRNVVFDAAAGWAAGAWRDGAWRADAGPWPGDEPADGHASGGAAAAGTTTDHRSDAELCAESAAS
ncbi:MAG: alginate lyase family protein [Gemmatimonadaceae bacterium]